MKQHLVVLTGAGISAESGLKTFRDSDGLWEGYAIEEVATPGAWHRNPALVLEFYNYRRKAVREAEPNAAHYGIAALQDQYEVTVITQNIDDLHERAGSRRVIHLHGEIFKMRSEADEGLVYPVSGDIKIGDRAEDGAQLRPHIVWFGEPVPMIETAAMLVNQSKLFAVIGTSLQVYPAAGLLQYADPAIPKFIIDKKIPPTGSIENLTVIEQPATSGVQTLQKLLTVN